MATVWLIGVCSGALALAATCHRLLTRRLIVVSIHGLSMLPTYSPGDRVLVRRGTKPGRGEVVVVEPPNDGWPPGVPVPPWLIKRVAAVPGDRVAGRGYSDTEGGTVPAGMLFLLGDNAKLSMDSRQMGLFSTRQLLGTVVCKL